MDGSNAVILNYMRTTYMWEKIRVQGGAYGAMLSFDQNSGAFNFLSYRDPNLLETLENYDGAADFLRGLEISEAELTKAIIGSIGEMDAHQLPDAKGYSSMVRYLTNYTEEARQAYREQVLSASKADFKAFAEVLDEVKENGQVVVLGSAEAVKEANQERGGFLDVKQVM